MLLFFIKYVSTLGYRSKILARKRNLGCFRNERYYTRETNLPREWMPFIIIGLLTVVTGVHCGAWLRDWRHPCEINSPQAARSICLRVSPGGPVRGFRSPRHSGKTIIVEGARSRDKSLAGADVSWVYVCLYIYV